MPKSGYGSQQNLVIALDLRVIAFFPKKNHLAITDRWSLKIDSYWLPWSNFSRWNFFQIRKTGYQFWDFFFKSDSRTSVLKFFLFAAEIVSRKSLAITFKSTSISAYDEKNWFSPTFCYNLVWSSALCQTQWTIFSKSLMQKLLMIYL